VVVPTYRRPHRLAGIVAALEAQTIDEPFEVLIVDNGNDEETAATLDQLARTTTLDLRVLRIDRNHGPAPARNLGWRAARAELVAFTDDDCVPQPGWLAALHAGFDGADIVQGSTRANPTQRATGPFAWAPETDASGRFETCNIAYRRRLLAELGGFDEGYHDVAGGPAIWGDDTDLGLRAVAGGALEASAPAAVVWHDVKPGRLRDRLADLPRRGGVVRLLREHPEQRDELPWPWFVHPAHAWMAVIAVATPVALAGPARPAGRAVAAAGLAGWARSRARGCGRRELVSVLPQWFVVDAVEVAVLARASLRARALYL
jgi:glycosyltransferase involved in cell wall biosynthesis